MNRHKVAELIPREREVKVVSTTPDTPVTVKVKKQKSDTDNNNDVLTAIELAAILRCHPVTVRLDAAAGKIPGRQVGNRWRFSRRVIEAWLAHQEAA